MCLDLLISGPESFLKPNKIVSQKELPPQQSFGALLGVILAVV